MTRPMKRSSTGKDGASEVLVGQAAIWKVGRGIVMLAANKLLERREARFLSCHERSPCQATCYMLHSIGLGQSASRCRYLNLTK